MPKQAKSKTENFAKHNRGKTSIPGLLVIEGPTYKDQRGFFHEVFRLKDLELASGIKFRPIQVNHSMSIPKVIRAIHTETWNKLIYPVTGKMFAAIVDVRPESKVFGRVETFTFDNEPENSTHKALFLPKGLGNSICVIGDEPVNYLYLVDEYWDDKKAKGIAWDDADLKIKWPIKNPIISERDKNNPTLAELYPEKFTP
ncbi:MAG: dTDP-4-dehydrorhamnose 3,5-epimerase family protein [Patescibacteria group bacterium]